MAHWRCGVVVIALNEEKVIKRCLESLRNQRIGVFLVVVNDGSMDRTGEIASTYADIVVNLPSHKENWTGTPELARVFNAGFDVLRDRDVEYVLISGADNDYPSDYVEEITDRMKNEEVIVSSGVIQGEVSRSLSPRGGGRVVDARWFKRTGFRYPVNYGFEVYLVYKALSQGLRVTVYQDVKFMTSRRTELSRRKLHLWGKGMKALNYWWLYALGRAAIIGLKNPLNGFTLLKGYLSEVSEQYEDLKEFVPNLQKRMLVERVQEVLGFKQLCNAR